MIKVRDIYLRSVLHDAITEASAILRNSILDFKPFCDIVCNKAPKLSITLTREESRLYGSKK